METKIINHSINQSINLNQSEEREIFIVRADEKSKQKETNCLRRGKTRVTKFQFCISLVEKVALVFLDQSQSEVKQKQCNPGLLLILN